MLQWYVDLHCWCTGRVCMRTYISDTKTCLLCNFWSWTNTASRSLSPFPSPHVWTPSPPQNRSFYMAYCRMCRYIRDICDGYVPKKNLFNALIWVHSCAYMYEHSNVNTCTSTQTFTYSCTCTCTYTCAHIYIYIYIHMHILIHIHTHMHMHVYKFTHIFEYWHVYLHTRA